MVNDVTGEQVPEGVEGTSVVLLMVRDAYANYVVQTTLDVVADETEKHLLMEELNSHSTELVRTACDFSVHLAQTEIYSPVCFPPEKLHLRQTHRHEVGNLV
jgi:hypothetical protein